MNAALNPRIPVLIIGRGNTALGSLRSLAMAGISAYVACPANDLVTRSRWYRPPPGLPCWDGTIGPDTTDLLGQLHVEKAVLMAACDDAAMWISGVPGSGLAERFLVSSSSARTLDVLQDKARFGQFLEDRDIPHPWTLSITSESDIEAIPFGRLDRVFLKPVNSQHASAVLGAKGLWAGNRDQFRKQWRALQRKGLTFVAQEYVPGGSDDHYFIDGFRGRDGRFNGLFARRRLRIYPADFGNSSYCESVALDTVQAALTGLKRLLIDLRYRGVFSAEFKLDARCGSFRLLEVNTRPWWYVEFASRCGVNVCQMAYQDALGLPVSDGKTDYPVSVGCVNLGSDLKAVRSSNPSNHAQVSQLLRQWSKAHYHVMRWNDPGPVLNLFGGWFRRAFARLWHFTNPPIGRARRIEADPSPDSGQLP